MNKSNAYLLFPLSGKKKKILLLTVAETVQQRLEFSFRPESKDFNSAVMTQLNLL